MDFITKFFLKHEISNKQLRVKLKSTIFASVTATIFFTSLFTVIYFLGFNLFRDKGVESQKEIARVLASAIDSTIEKEAEQVKLNANSQFVIDALKENNLKYRVMGERGIQRYLMDMNKRWIEVSDDGPFLKDYLENKLSHRLSGLKIEEKKLVSVTIADKFGGLVGSTTRPSKFYSFDQDWWLSAYAQGGGYDKPFIGNVEYDEARNLWCLPFAVPIEDEAGSVIGVYKASISLDTFFKPLLNFKIGETGRVVLADDKAYLVYHDGALPFANKYCEYKEFKKTLDDRDKWGVLDTAYLNRGKTLVAYSEVNLPFLSAKGINWFVFVERDIGEIFAPLGKFISIVILIGILLVIILALSVFILSGQESLSYSMFHMDEDALVKKTEDKNHNYIEKRDEDLQKDK